MDIVFVLDVSGSVDIVYHVILNFTKQMVLGLPMAFGRTRVGLITFRDRARISFYLDTYTTQEEVLNAIAYGRAEGRTNIQEGIYYLYRDVFSSRRGDRAGVDNVAVFVTDGASNVYRRKFVLTKAISDQI